MYQFTTAMCKYVKPIQQKADRILLFIDDLFCKEVTDEKYNNGIEMMYDRLLEKDKCLFFYETAEVSPGSGIYSADIALKAIAEVKDRLLAVLCDMRFGENTRLGLEIMHRVKENYPDIKFYIMSGEDDPKVLQEIERCGVKFIEKLPYRKDLADILGIDDL